MGSPISTEFRELRLQREFGKAMITAQLLDGNKTPDT
jgi:hypothetical protein